MEWNRNHTGTGMRPRQTHTRVLLTLYLSPVLLVHPLSPRPDDPAQRLQHGEAEGGVLALLDPSVDLIENRVNSGGEQKR